MLHQGDDDDMCPKEGGLSSLLLDIHTHKGLNLKSLTIILCFCARAYRTKRDLRREGVQLLCLIQQPPLSRLYTSTDADYCDDKRGC